MNSLTVRCRRKRIGIRWVLRPAQPIPPGKVQSEVPARPFMVKMVMRDGGRPAEPAPRDRCPWENLVTRMSQGIPDDHVQRERKDRHGVQRDDHHRSGQEERLEHGFAGMKAVGSPRRGLA